MSSPEGLTLLGVTIVLAGLIGILILAVVRLRGDRTRGGSRERISEEAFMATAIREALAERDRKQSELAEQTSATLDTRVVDHLQVGVLVVGTGGDVHRINARARELLGVQAAIGLPASAGELLGPHPALLALIESARASPRASPQTSNARLDLVRSGDRHVTVEAVCSPLAVAGPHGLVVSLVDVTGAEQQEALRRRREIMAEVARLGSNLAHELANSLTAVHGYSRMIDGSVLSAADRAALESVLKETDVLGATIEAFRRVTRPLGLMREVFPIRWAVDDAAALVTREQEVARDAVVGRVPESLQVDGDRVLLEDALAHVLRNAVEACQHAGIPPRVTVTSATSPGDASVALIVEDNGPGVPAAERPQLFDLFFSTKANHAGMGLARARHIVQSHDGTISASHPESGGLSVTITLPLSKTARASTPTR